MAYLAHWLCDLQAHCANNFGCAILVIHYSFAYLWQLLYIFCTVTWLSREVLFGSCQPCVGKLYIYSFLFWRYIYWAELYFDFIDSGCRVVEWLTSVADRIGFNFYPKFCNHYCININLLFWGLLINMFVLYRDIYTYTSPEEAYSWRSGLTAKHVEAELIKDDYLIPLSRMDTRLYFQFLFRDLNYVYCTFLLGPF